MAKVSDLSGDERAARVAALKAKMQAAAAKKAAAASEESNAESAEKTEAVAVVEESPPVAAEAPGPTAEGAGAESAQETSAPATDAQEAAASAPVIEGSDNRAAATNGATAATATAAIAADETSDEDDEEARLKRHHNRREFLTYAWGAALGLLTLETGVLTYFFMYPRFEEGTFGGKFRNSIFGGGALPPIGASPTAIVDGKFWWINIEDEGPKAIYMVCTHLGCLYKWVEETFRFECPCHGSKFTREGLYIEGPAPRSLDSFEVFEEGGDWVVDTGAKINGAPASESPAAGTG